MEDKKNKFLDNLDFINWDFSIWYITQIASAELVNYSQNADKIRETLDIKYFKKKIEWTWSEEEKEEIREEIALNILREVHKFPWLKLESASNSSSPKKILESKEMVCVWKAIISSQFLLELWIEHYALKIPRHSALSIILSWKEYYYDPTWNNDMYEINEDKLWKNWNYHTFKYIRYNWNKYMPSQIDVEFIRRNPEKWLLSDILWNRWLDLKNQRNYSLAIKYFEKYIDLYPENMAVYRILYGLQYKLKHKAEEDKKNKQEEANKYDYRSWW